MKKSKQKKRNNTPLYFFIGTEAEFIKLFPVLAKLDTRKTPYTIIASGQNDISDSLLFQYIDHKTIDLTLSRGPKKQTPLALFVWFIRTFIKGYMMMRQFISHANRHAVLVVHGDTVSTVMGAYLGKLLGMRIAHIEAGLRSFNFLHPFPEEIDRVLTSKIVDVHFCPNEWAMKNVEKKQGVKVNTQQNTLLDSLRIVTKRDMQSTLLKKVAKKKFFIFVMHRQENLMNEDLVKSIVKLMVKQAEKMTCVFILHKPTKVALEHHGLLKRIEEHRKIITTDRLPYIEIMNLMKNAEFLVTDGGSNQEESYYFGKPCLVLRQHTERIEGIDANVVLSMNNITNIKSFLNNYTEFQREPVSKHIQPSSIIANYLTNSL